ncbi:MAG TPA: serine hydrolase [Nitrospirota bacterium]|nr:serine hydrolase [Nitrospirota bacterium]
MEKTAAHKMTMSRSHLMTLLLGALALGFFIGSGMVGLLSPLQTERSDEIALTREGAFRFIRTSTETNNAAGQPAKELKPFRYKINDLLDERLHTGVVASAAVYFRDLNNGNWIGINEREIFSSKILLKLPLMIAYFKWAESNPLVLRRTLTLAAGAPGERVPEGSPSPIEPGKPSSVNDLIFRMIAYDDDSAYTLLRANIPNQRLDRVFKDLNVEYNPRDEADSLSVRGYASFYRVLFNSSYLSEEMSEKALRYLSKSSFRAGMASGIPANIDIASKFGKRLVTVAEHGEERELYQLHEYGIIYHPHRPFLLGIMVRGDDESALVKTIRDITRLVYDELDQQS